MSTLVHADASRDMVGGTPARRLVSGVLALVFLCDFCALTGFCLLFSVTPMYTARAGGGSAGAGLVTGVLLLGTVAAELAAPMLMKRYAYRTLLGLGAALLGVPALALLSGGPLVVIVAVSVVRGFGFGLGTVVAGALTAVLLPPERRGEGLGLFGIAACVPEVVALPSGVWLAGHYGIALVVGLAAATALVPLAAFPWLPVAVGGRTTASGHSTGLLAGLRVSGELRLSLIFVASTVAAGVVVAFLPLTAGVPASIAAVGLLAQAVTATVSRWWAGRHGDRHGHAPLLTPGLAIASLGVAGMIWAPYPAVLIAAMCVFGTGFGITQNATFALMIDRMPASGLGTASALWNLAYDAGYGAGPVAFGLFVGRTGYPVAFAITAAVMLVALPLARCEHRGR